MANFTEDDVIKLCSTVVSSEAGWDSLVAWDGLRPWLAQQGYHLFLWDDETDLWYPQHDVETESDLYFAEMGGKCHYYGNCHQFHPLEVRFRKRVGFAQDSSFHHVCLKIFKSGTEEHKILRFLHANREEAIINCVMPVLNFLKIGDYYIAVMARWGDDPQLPWFSTVRQAGIFIRDILKAYNYLHQHYIIYRDIKLGNILLNHFSGQTGLGVCSELNEKRLTMKGNHQIRYTLCDFDFSQFLSPPPSGESIRLPGELSFYINQDKPYDTIHGEPDYDPFAFDIGCLGICLWQLFGKQVESFPLIVPLVDKMITGRLEDRFTAKEALQFVEDHILGDPIDSRLDPSDCKIPNWDPDLHDKWANLPADFVEKWGMYKAPKSKHWDRVLKKLCSTSYVAYRTIKFSRWLCQYFKASARHVGLVMTTISSWHP